MPRILNIGSGRLNQINGQIGLDVDFSCKPTVCGKAEAMPFKDRTFDEVYAIHVLEHIPDIVSALNEVYRVLKWDGRFIVEVPLFPHYRAMADPTHVRYFVEETFHYFTKKDALPGFNGIFQFYAMRKGDGVVACEMRKN